MQKGCHIPIPARSNAPATNLYSLLVYEDESSLTSKPYIIFLTGGPGMNHSHYKDYHCLQSIANIIFYDPRGCGLSERGDPVTYTMENNIDDVNSIREFYKLDKVILLGKSYGAMCALGHAIKYPSHITQLLLAAGSHNYKSMRTAKINASKRHLSITQRAVLKKVWSGKLASDEDAWNGLTALSTLYSYKLRHGGTVNRPTHDYPFAHEPANIGFKSFLRTFQFTHQLHRIQSPTLILVGDEDWVTDKKHSIEMHKKIKHSELIVFPESDHSMESDVPEKYFSAIKGFITRGIK